MKYMFLRLRYMIVILAACVGLPDTALAVETTAKQAIVIDYDTGNVLYAKDADETVGPASMTKMMTISLVRAAERRPAVA